MKTLKFYALTGAFALSMMITGCSKDEETPAYTPQDGNQQLSTLEYTGLINLYEQQKLHLDVYTVMVEKTEWAFFQKLVLEEQIVLDLLAEKFEIYDERNPLKLKGPGEYLSSKATGMYAEFELISDAGLLSVLQFAVKMEKSTTGDITDYMEVLKKADLTLVCQDMLSNSTAHIDLLYNEMKSPNVVILPINPVTEY